MSTRVLDPSRQHIVLRVAAALLGGYAFAWGFIALGTAALFAAGMPFHDAEFLSSMLGILAYLAVFLWVFAVPGLRRAGAVLVGAGAAMAGLASLLQHTLV